MLVLCIYLENKQQFGGLQSIYSAFMHIFFGFFVSVGIINVRWGRISENNVVIWEASQLYWVDSSSI